MVGSRSIDRIRRATIYGVQSCTRQGYRDPEQDRNFVCALTTTTTTGRLRNVCGADRRSDVFYFSHFSLFESLNYFWREKYYFSKKSFPLCVSHFYLQRNTEHVRSNPNYRSLLLIRHCQDLFTYYFRDVQ